MDLHYRYFGGEGNPPLVIIHGLLGSSRNWLTVGRDLTRQYEVFAVDLRNHGDSPHADAMDFDTLAADLETFLDARGLEHATLLGHSLGGKTAMRFACLHPERTDALIVVDIAPKAYNPHNQRDFEAMLALPVQKMVSRKDAEAFLAEYIMDWAQRQFLLTNLKRNEEGEGFAWTINLPALHAARVTMRENPLGADDRYAGPALFVLGGKSGFVEPEDWEKIRYHFPKARIQSIDGVGHNPHIDNRLAFLAVLDAFHSTGRSQS